MVLSLNASRARKPQQTARKILIDRKLEKARCYNIWPYFYGTGGIGETITIAEIQRLTRSEIFGFFKIIIHKAKIAIEAIIIIFNRIIVLQTTKSK